MKKLLLTVSLSFCTFHAFAHSPFLAPSNYIVNGGNTSILAGFAEKAFDSEVAIRGFNFKVINPKAESQNIELVQSKSLSIGNVDTALDGTYEVLGERIANIEYAKDGKRWLRVLDGKNTKVPPLSERDFILEGEVTSKHQKYSVERHDRLMSFFTKYKVSDLNKQSNQTGLNIEFSTHPNLIKRNTPFVFTAKIDGKPVTGYLVHVEKQQTNFNQNDKNEKLTTNALGQVSLNLSKEGQYIITVTSPEVSVTEKPQPKTYRTIASVFVSE